MAIDPKVLLAGGSAVGVGAAAVVTSAGWWSVFVNHPAQWSAGAAVLAGTAACIATATGVRTLRQTRRDSAARARDSVDQVRPYVLAELRKPPYVHGSQVLVIRNVGRTEARTLYVRFEPEIPSLGEGEPVSQPFEALRARYQAPIKVLAPGQELENIWYAGQSDADGTFVNTQPTPDAFTITFDYLGPTGQAYSAAFDLDISLLRYETFMTSSGSPDNQLKEAASALKGIRQQLAGGVEVHPLTPKQRDERSERMATDLENAQLRAMGKEIAGPRRQPGPKSRQR